MKILTLVCVLAVLEYSAQESFAPKPFDFLTMRETWPVTQCLNPGARTCEIDSKVSDWVIHGLWPNYFGGSWPSYCDISNNRFDANQVSSLLNDLNKFWPNLYTDTGLTSFWKHEWEKHGTCALNMYQINSQTDYFKVTMDLHRKYNYGAILKRAGIVPSDTKTYSLNSISDAIESELKYAPYISCGRESDGKQYIYELGICFNYDLELINCANPEGREFGFENIKGSNCYKSLPVRYPKIH